ncbi:uncharacterized protein J3R85_017424 [Psidium guajava]|nr:uncharacterized protein J3R85_017424 [Psidium guajava]
MSATLTKRSLLTKEIIYSEYMWTPHTSDESLGNFSNKPHEQTKQALLWFVEDVEGVLASFA